MGKRIVHFFSNIARPIHSNKLRKILRYLMVIAALVFSLKAIFTASPSDDRAFYYGARCILQGVSPYNNKNIVDEWRRTGAPASYRPGLPIVPYLYTPHLVLFLAPVALLPWQYAPAAFRFLQLMCFFCCLLALNRFRSDDGKFCDNVTSTTLCLILPPVIYCLTVGQIGLMILLAATLGWMLILRGKDISGGALVALSLAKFSLTFPLLLVLLYAKKWKAVFWAAGIFLLVNLLLILPMGFYQVYTDYRLTLASTLQPGGVNDAAGLSRYDSRTTMIHTGRLTYAIMQDRNVAAIADKIITVLGLGALAFLFKERDSTGTLHHPLTLPIILMMGLCLFYHRVHDLCVLVPLVYGLVDYRLKTFSALDHRGKLLFKVTVCLTALAAFGSHGGLGVAWLIDCLSESLFMGALKPIIVLALTLCLYAILIRDTRCAALQTAHEFIKVEAV